jgi:hypothetical protein
MSLVRDLIAKHLLKDRHRALFVLNSKKYEINSKNRNVTITWGGSGSCRSFIMVLILVLKITGSAKPLITKLLS